MAAVSTFSEGQLTQLARSIAPRLKAGDTVLLQGDVGAGKSVFARALIRSVLVTPETDIPSPSFTLIQTYQGKNAEIWHADLYRLSTSDELIELGLDDAFQDAITLIEWPERLEHLRPERYMLLQLKPVLTDAGARALEMKFVGDNWEDVETVTQNFFRSQEART